MLKRTPSDYTPEVVYDSTHSPKLSSILQYSMDDWSMDDNFGEWMESMGVDSGRG